MANQITTLISWVLGLFMIIFGLNKFLNFIPVGPPADPIAQQFLGTMFSSYLYVVVALGELIGGALLCIPGLRFAGWLTLLPILFNIVAFHVAHDFIGNGIWILPMLLYGVIGYVHKQRIAALFTAG